MSEQELIEQLDRDIEAVLTGRRAEDRALSSIVEALRDLPDPQFKASLKWRIVPRVRHTITPHFRVRGAAEFIDFLERAFGATEEFRATMPDGSIAHAEVRINDSMIEMGEANDQYPPHAFAIHLYVDDVDAVYQRAVEAGATTLHPLVDQFYGDREAALKDPFGNQWYIATHLAPGHPIRPGLRAVTPFFHPHGVDRVMDFLTAAFGASTLEEPHKTPDGLIAHVAMRIGDSVLEMGEHHGEWQPMEAGIHLYVDDADAVYRQAVAAGAKTIDPPYDAPYGERSAYVVDPWGNHWYIGTPKM